MFSANFFVNPFLYGEFALYSINVGTIHELSAENVSEIQKQKAAIKRQIAKLHNIKIKNGRFVNRPYNYFAFILFPQNDSFAHRFLPGSKKLIFPP